jgi:Domain of unknown function (DUF4062)
MANNRKVVQIFLASPGDLQDERQAAKAAVDAFNRRWADWLGIQVELIGWEDTFKRFGRPQEQINLDLDRCEAFIGMMWRKWGSPPGGHYTSGFEEEFERATKNRKSSGRPEMTLFLKKIDAEFLKDQGPDLKKVLTFRERIISERLILFEDFGTLREFEEKLTSWITSYVQSLKKLEATAASDDTLVRPSDEQPIKTEATPVAYTPLSNEGAKFVREFVTKTERDRESHPILSVDVARFRLLAAMVAVTGNDETVLGVHDANILFKVRSSLDLSRQEIQALIDSGLGNISHEVVPLWYWYVEAGAEESGYLSLSTLTGSQTLRVGALTAMRLIGEPIKPLAPISADNDGIDRAAFVSLWLSPSSNERVKVAALEYLSACGDETDLAILTEEYEKRNYQTVGVSVDAIIRINLKQSRERAVRSLIELQPENIDERLVDEIFAKPASLPTALILGATDHRNPKVRATVVPILTTRNALPTDVAERLLDDSSAAVRFEALRSLIRDGREFPDDKIKSILVKPAARGGLGGLFGTYPPTPADKEGELLWERFTKLKLRAESEPALGRMLTDATILDHDARFALDFKGFKTRAVTLRLAVDNQFKDEFNAGLRTLEQLLTNTDTLNRIKSIEEGIRKEMVRKGTDILCEKCELEDLDRIRRVVSSGFVKFSPLDAEYFKKHGEWQDIHLLIGVLDRSDGANSLLGGLFDDDKVRPIAEAIHSISKARFPELCRVAMPDRLLSRVIDFAADKEIAELSDSDFVALFALVAEDVRKAVLPKAVRALSKTRLKKLLTAYSNYDGARYYNVFYWLDLGISLTRKQALHAVNMTARKRR